MYGQIDRWIVGACDVRLLDSMKEAWKLEGDFLHTAEAADESGATSSDPKTKRDYPTHKVALQ